MTATDTPRPYTPDELAAVRPTIERHNRPENPQRRLLATLDTGPTAIADTSTAVFAEAARRLAADIDNETGMAGRDVAWLREIVRSANAAVSAVAAARRTAENAYMAAREAAR